MTEEEARKAFDELKAKGETEDTILGVLYLMFQDDKFTVEELGSLVKVLGYKLTPEFLAMSPEDQKTKGWTPDENFTTEQDTKNEKSSIEIIKEDITELDCDAIVNAANSGLYAGGGVCGAIHRVAGEELEKECRTLGGCDVGNAKITKGYNLKAKYVIHAVGPHYTGSKKDEIYLANCYINSLNIAKQKGIRTIAFPSISTGIYGYPHKLASEIAYKTVYKWLTENEDYSLKVIFCCYDTKTEDCYLKFQKDMPF